VRPVLPGQISLRVCLATLALLATQSLHAAADHNREVIEKALRSVDAAQQDSHWHFTMTMVEEGERRIIRHDPLQKPLEQRTLLSVDGMSPDKKQLKAFRKQEEQRIEDRDPEANFSYLVDLKTLKHTAQTDNHAEISFSPRVKRMEDFRDELAGKLVLNTQTEQIEKIEIYNTEKFSPAFSVTLESYLLTFHFRDEQGARLLDNLLSSAVGKVGFLKKFDTETSISFSDYRPVSAVTTEPTE
jgi:hypothetical protein